MTAEYDVSQVHKLEAKFLIQKLEAEHDRGGQKSHVMLTKTERPTFGSTEFSLSGTFLFLLLRQTRESQGREQKGAPCRRHTMPLVRE